MAASSPSGALGPRHRRVQRLRRLVHQRSARVAERALVIEGATLVEVALDAGTVLEEVFVAPDGLAHPVVARAHGSGVAVHALAAGVLERVAGTVTPQPVLAVARWSERGIDEVAGADLVVVCVDVRDPGNAGAVLRSAEAAGAAAVVFCDGSVDVSNPKCVRASAGSVFRVTVASGGAPAAVLDRLRQHGLRRLGAVARGGVPYDEADLTGPVAIVVGNEAHGLPPEVEAALDGLISIPMAGRAESLNVGMAAAVVCFEVARQRRRRGGYMVPRDPAAAPTLPPMPTPPAAP